MKVGSWIIQEEGSWIIQDEISWIDALFPRARSVEKLRRNHFETGKVCCGNFLYVGLSIHGHTHGYQHEVVV